MHSLTLANGRQIPQLGYGVFTMSSEEVARCLPEAIAAGYTHTDTANAYFNEVAVGRAVRASGADRESLFVTTKLFPQSYPYAQCGPDIDASLERLGMDYVDGLRAKCYEAMNDDLNSPVVISHLFDACRVINTIIDKKATIGREALEALSGVFRTFAFDILGLKEEAGDGGAREEAFGQVVDMLLEQRMAAKANKDWATSDKIRDRLAALGFEVKDTKDGFTWRLDK